MNAPQEQPQEQERPRRSRAQRVVEEVCLYYGLDEGVLRAHLRTCGCATRNSCRCGRSPRGKSYSMARMMICYLLSVDLACGHMRIALLLRRDHSTINYNVGRLETLLPSRGDLRWHLGELRAILRAKGVLRAREP